MIVCTPIVAIAHAYTRVAKHIRRAMRHHWNVGHHTSRVLWRGGVAYVCVVTPAAIGWGWLHGPALAHAGGWIAGPVAVPEPSSIVVLAAAVLVLAVVRRVA